MRDRDQTKEQLLREMAALRRRNAELEASQTKCRVAEKTLRDELDKTRTLLDACPDVAVLANTEGLVVASNQATARILGNSPDELIGRSLFDLFSPELVEHTKELAEEAMDSGKPGYLQAEWRGRWFDQRVVPVLGFQGRATGFALFARDITERKGAGEELRYQVGFERLITDVSSSFTDRSPVEIERAIADAVQAVGELVGIALAAMQRRHEAQDQESERRPVPPT